MTKILSLQELDMLSRTYYMIGMAYQRPEKGIKLPCTTALCSLLPCYVGRQQQKTLKNGVAVLGSYVYEMTFFQRVTSVAAELRQFFIFLLIELLGWITSCQCLHTGLYSTLPLYYEELVWWYSCTETVTAGLVFASIFTFLSFCRGGSTCGS